MSNMTPEILELALEKLSDYAKQHDKLIEIAIFGGSALAIAFNLREATKDIDAVFDNYK